MQQEAVDFYTGCCNVIASAGSGKTRVLVNRIAKLITEHDVDPRNILAITFSKKAKDNMIGRLKELLPEYYEYLNVETFHSFGYRIIRKFEPNEFEILDVDWKKVKIIEEIIQKKFREKKANGEEIANALAFISYEKNKMIPPDLTSRMGRIYAEYEAYKKTHKLIDFDDMLTKCYELLAENNVLEYCQEQFRFILADEMQDTNAIQYEILRLIGQKYKNIFVVDDPLQNIFMWRGSDNKFVLDFDDEWPGAKTIQLNKNYRSSKDIVSLANKFAEFIPESGHKHYVESVADKQKYAEPIHMIYANEIDEADSISVEIETLIKKDYDYQDIAILTRTNAQLQHFETSLYSKSIPYTVCDGLSFVDRKEIKLILSYLRLINDNDDDEAFEYIYNKPNRYLGMQFIQDVKKIARKEGISLFRAAIKAGRLNWKYQKA